jgi:hypothetical protein
LPTNPSANTYAPGIMIGEFTSWLLVAGGARVFPDSGKGIHTSLLEQPSRAEE